MQWSTRALHLPEILEAAKEVLTDIRREADDEGSTHRLQMDIWLHLGLQLITDVTDGKFSCTHASVFRMEILVVQQSLALHVSRLVGDEAS